MQFAKFKFLLYYFLERVGKVEVTKSIGRENPGKKTMKIRQKYKVMAKLNHFSN